LGTRRGSGKTSHTEWCDGSRDKKKLPIRLITGGAAMNGTRELSASNITTLTLQNHNRDLLSRYRFVYAAL
jgi:hypothetical protein